MNTNHKQNDSLSLRTVNVVRYVTPLREGGSLPAIAEGDDGHLYVLKFRGAGQGVKALIAELIGGEIARLLGLRVPEIVLATLDESFGRTEGDEEIQDLLKFSEGLNLAMTFLSGAITYDPVVHIIGPTMASKIVWLDAFLMNMDRTVKNTNLLFHNKLLWLIDHGAALYFHHAGLDWSQQSQRPFTHIKEHVLLPLAGNLEAADAEARELLSDEALASIIRLIPDEFIFTGPHSTDARPDYLKFLIDRRNHSSIFVNEALNARKSYL